MCVVARLLTAAALCAASVHACAADNCYRALFPCPSPSAVAVASAFCATITADGVTATNYPTRATAACGTAPARYLSACQCGPTCSPTPPPPPPCDTAGSVPNGDFECGLAPWTVQLPDPAATYGVVPSGYPSGGGGHAFEVAFRPPPVSPELGVSARVLSAALPVTPGVTYLLRYATWFDNGDAGFVGVMINDRPLQTVDAGDFGWGAWHVNELAWTAPPAAGTGTTTTSQAVLRFEFLFNGGTPSRDRLDAVSFTALASCDDGPWPGLLPNGDFECGLGSWTVQVPDSAVTAAGVRDSGGYVSPKVFEVDFVAPPVSPDGGVSARLWSKPLPVAAGRPYRLSFYVAFGPTAEGFVGVMINDRAVRTVDAFDLPPRGVYHRVEVDWTAPAGTTTASVKFEFILSATGSNKIDAVIFEPL